MFVWPKVYDNESTIIEKFEFLQDQLTTESATELCKSAPSCGFLMELYQVYRLDYEGAFQAYLTFLQTVVPLISRSTFLNMFPKSCPGCATLQFLCVLCLHPVLENEVYTLFRELLFDIHGDILHRNDIRQMAMMTRLAYQRRENLFPFMTNCFDFDKDSQGFKMAHAIGQLLSSNQFCELMKSNSTVGAQIAHEMLKNLEDSQRQPEQLKVLLSKYQELTSKSKFDT